MLAPCRLFRLRIACPLVQTMRSINLDKLSNKKITRLESEVEIDNSEFKTRLMNRNPRNLEQLSYEKKPSGFWLDKAPRSELYRLVFENSAGHQMAYLEHWSGKRILQASTDEPQLVKYFRNPNTTQAAALLGKIISQRCLQSGYLYAGVKDDEKSTSPKRDTFYEAVKLNGFTLEEFPEIEPRSATDL